MLSGVQTKGPTGSCWPSCWMINTLRWPRGRWIHCSQLCPWFSCDWRKSSGPSPVMTLLLSPLVGPLLSASLHLMPLYIAALIIRPRLSHRVCVCVMKRQAFMRLWRGTEVLEWHASYISLPRLEEYSVQYCEGEKADLPLWKKNSFWNRGEIFHFLLFS